MKNVLNALLLLVSATVSAQTETITYLHTDHLGSPVIARDAQGNTLWTDTYHPWGVRLNAPTANDADVGYTGHFEETDIGLTYAKARWYDPEIGRFLSPDAIGYLDGGFFHYNRYAYAANNPYKYLDSTGQSPSPVDVMDFGYGVGTLLVKEIVYVAAKLNGNEAVANMAAADMEEARTDAIFSTVGLVAVVPGTGRALKIAHRSSKYQPPPKSIAGIPGLKNAKPKTAVQGGGGLRKRWKDDKGNIYEWDSRHGTLEKYDKRGRHQGEYDPGSGEQLKPADRSRRVEP